MKSMILLCVCTVLVLRLETSTGTTGTLSVKGPHHHPIYKYSCNEDLSVTFKGVDGKIEYFPSNKKNASCNIKPVKDHAKNFMISKECMSTQSFDLDRTMQIAVYDENEGETIPTPMPVTPVPPTSTTTTLAPLVSGGHHIFEITCLALEKEGVERIALAETGITDIEQLHNVYNEIDQVEMRFKEGESLDKPDLSEVYIGDRFFMYLKYMGDTRQYIIMPQSCTAYKGTYRNEVKADKMDLWAYNDHSTDCLTNNAKTYHVMENFKRFNSTVVHAELLGFRFSSTLDGSSSDVTISCTVKICTSDTGPCKTSCGILPDSKRRKRETGTIRTHTVSKTLQVRNKKFDSNDAGRTSFSGGIVGIISASILFHILRK